VKTVSSLVDESELITKLRGASIRDILLSSFSRRYLMKKLTTLFTTTFITLALLMTSPSVMADPPIGAINWNNGPTALCLFFKRVGDKYGFDLLGKFGFKNMGQCVKFGKSVLKG